MAPGRVASTRLRTVGKTVLIDLGGNTFLEELNNLLKVETRERKEAGQDAVGKVHQIAVEAVDNWHITSDDVTPAALWFLPSLVGVARCCRKYAMEPLVGQGWK